MILILKHFYPHKQKHTFQFEKGEDNMKTYVFSYQLMVKDMAGGGINPDLSACKVYKEIYDSQYQK